VTSALAASILDPAEWDASVAAMPERTVFHNLAWLECLREEFGGRLELMGVRLQDRVVAVWPTLMLRRGPIRIAGSPLPGWATAYLGPLFLDSSLAGDCLREMHGVSEARQSHFRACRVMDRADCIDLAALGFTQTRRFETYLLDLTRSEDELWRGLKKECRSRIRKGDKNSIEIVEERDASYLDDFWEMSVEVYARAGRAPSYTRGMLSHTHERLFPHRLLALSAFADGRRIAGIVILHDDHSAMYWAGASRSDGLRLAPNNLLHWRAILACRDRGLMSYDMISTKGSKGRFKRSFSPAAVESATHWECYRPALIRLARNGYERWARRRRTQ
jgi:CelD/BcsL family acetyltransferase involved in cellulose biosynthesis